VIIVDSSIWIDHLRRRNERLSQLLIAGQALAHPYVVGELAMGNLSPRDEILNLLATLPQAAIASNAEVLDFIETKRLFGSGIGYIDAHVLASARLSAVALWTRDKRLLAIAAGLGLGPDPTLGFG
jgi:predicted nucleic acid-binding protein